MRKPRVGNKSKVDLLVGTVTRGLILEVGSRNWVLLLGNWNWDIDTGGQV